MKKFSNANFFTFGGKIVKIKCLKVAIKIVQKADEKQVPLFVRISSTSLSQNPVGIVRSMLNAKLKCNSLPEFYIVSLLHVYQSHSWLTLAAKQKRM